MQRHLHHTKYFAGFTLLEIMMAIVILLILGATAVPIMGGLKERAARSTCISRMKRIYFALDSYVKEVGHFPQQPADLITGSDEQGLWRWWQGQLQDYGITPQDWLCPVEEAAILKSGEKLESASSFIPTNFDDGRITPYRWNQPWLMERADFHGKGNHMVMPDGSLQLAPTEFSNISGGK